MFTACLRGFLPSLDRPLTLSVLMTSIDVMRAVRQTTNDVYGRHEICAVYRCA